MVPDVAKAGHSFKGAFAYYLHDKRQDERAAHPATAARVAWTETRNLATDDPAAAKRIMIATASRADELKAAAGIKATGRKSSAHVYAYSLAWHPDEAGKLDRAEMMRAADASLKVLAAEQHQAVIVCHTDRTHPHLHVIVNRVHPDTGKMLATSNDFRKLSDWANAYERERGKIVTPQREEKRQARESFRSAARSTPPQAQPAPQRPAQRPTRPAMVPSQAAILKALTDDQKARHKAAWPALSERNKAAREAIFAAYGQQIKTAAARHKELSRPLWAQHFRQERSERRGFEQREREALGIVVNALAAAKHQQASGQAPGRGLLSLTFANVLDGQARAQAFTAQQDMRRGEVARQLRAALDAEVSAIKAARADALTRQREAFNKARADLIEQQTAERAKNREAWQQVYARDGKQPLPRARQQAARHMENQPVRDDFDKAKRLAQANPAPHPTDRRHVSQPAPTPAPAGTPPLPARAVQDVPRKPDPVMPKQEPKPLPAKDWTKASSPAGPSLPAKDWTRAAAPPSAPPPKDWSAKPEPSREIKPLPPRSKDRERER